MILILINFHFLCTSEYESMLVQAGSFWIPFSLLETVVFSIYTHIQAKNEKKIKTILRAGRVTVKTQ